VSDGEQKSRWDSHLWLKLGIERRTADFSAEKSKEARPETFCERRRAKESMGFPSLAQIGNRTPD